MRFVIFGSCVTRDVFEFMDMADCQLVRYFARSSLGSAYTASKVDDIDISGIDSSFQRAVVYADLNKEFENFIERGEFDWLIYDPIDERFDLLLFEDDKVCTFSNELRAVYDPTDVGKVRRLKSGTEEFYIRWESGWVALVAQLDRLGKRSSLRINKVFWAGTTAAGNDFRPTYDAAGIKRANEFLERIYSRMLTDIHREQFFEFSPELMVGANEHKWGASPFHYIEAYYEGLARALEGLARNAGNGCAVQHFAAGNQINNYQDYLVRLLKEEVAQSQAQVRNIQGSLRYRAGSLLMEALSPSRRSFHALLSLLKLFFTQSRGRVAKRAASTSLVVPDVARCSKKLMLVSPLYAGPPVGSGVWATPDAAQLALVMDATTTPGTILLQQLDQAVLRRLARWQAMGGRIEWQPVPGTVYSPILLGYLQSLLDNPVELSV